MVRRQHSGEKHNLIRRQTRLFGIDAVHDLVWSTIEDFDESWRAGCAVGLRGEKCLIRSLTARVGFGRIHLTTSKSLGYWHRNYDLRQSM